MILWWTVFVPSTEKNDSLCCYFLFVNFPHCKFFTTNLGVILRIWYLNICREVLLPMILYDKQKCYCVTLSSSASRKCISTAPLLIYLSFTFLIYCLEPSQVSSICSQNIYHRPPPPPFATIHHHTLVPTTICFMILHPSVTSTWFMSSVSKTTAIDPFLTVSSPHLTSLIF